MERKRLIAILELTLAVLAWGGSFVATKIALQEVSPATIIWLRFGIGVLILGVAVLARHQVTLPAWRELGYFALLGFLGITFHQWLQANGLKTAQATTTAWIVATTPIFIALLGWLVLKEKLRLVQGFGILLAALGVLLVVSRGNFSSLGNGSFGAPGDFLILLSSPNWAIFSVLSRRGLRQFLAATMMLYVMGFGWLFSSIFLFAGPGLSEIGQLTQPGWLAIAFLGVFCSGLAYIFWYDGLKALPVAQAGAFVYLEPFVTVLVAWVVLSEPLLWASLLGGGLILAGVWLVQRQGIRGREEG